MSETAMGRPLLARIVNPGVPWWIAVPCNVLAVTAVILVVIDSDHNLTAALVLLGLAAITLYGMALARWRRGKRE